MTADEKRDLKYQGMMETLEELRHKDKELDRYMKFIMKQKGITIKEPK